MRKNMAHNRISEREAIAAAACDLAGRERPVSSFVEEKDRVYLFACPGDFGGKFCADDLSERLERTGVSHGVNWDSDSAQAGVRFVVKSMRLPAELKPFASEQARSSWEAWKASESEVSAVVADAALRVARGEMIDLEGGAEASRPRQRLHLRGSGERN